MQKIVLKQIKCQCASGVRSRYMEETLRVVVSVCDLKFEIWLKLNHGRPFGHLYHQNTMLIYFFGCRDVFACGVIFFSVLDIVRLYCTSRVKYTVNSAKFLLNIIDIFSLKYLCRCHLYDSLLVVNQSAS